MQVLRYPVELCEAEDGITVTFPDMPYSVTFGKNKEDALYNAVDCLEEIIASLMNDKKDIRHSTLGYLSPAEFERRFYQQQLCS